MKVSTITITDVSGISSLTLSPGSVTVLSGRNGCGKSSVLTAIDAVIAGGHDPTIIRKGAEKATITIELDDGTTIKRTVTEKASTLTITTKDGDKKAAPKTYLEKLVDTTSWNPAKFLDAKPTDRMSMLLSALPIKADRDQLGRLLGGTKIDAWPIGIHPLDGIARVKKAIFDERTFYNRATNEKAAHLADLRKTLPEQEDSDARSALDAAMREAKALDDEAAARKEQIAAEERASVEKIDRDLAAQIATLNNGADVDIGRLQAQIEAIKEQIALRRERLSDELSGVRETASGEKVSVKAKANEALEQLAATLDPRRTPLLTRIGQARERVKAQESAEAMRARLDELDTERRAHAKTATELTRLLDVVDQYRDSALGDLPIPGVSVADGEVFVADPSVADGQPLPWPRVNRSRQVRLAVDVARLRAGELGLVILDEAEGLDEETWREFVQAAKESGGQIIAARVSDDMVLRVSEGRSA